MIYIQQDKIEDYIEKYISKLEESCISSEEIEDRLERHIKKNVIIKYDKEWKDSKYDEIMHLLTEVPGGYWIVQEYMRMPHVEFQHDSQIYRKSYEKGNISDEMAKNELTEKGYGYYKHFKSKGLTKNTWFKKKVHEHTPLSTDKQE